MTDPWKREQLPSAVDDAADVMCGYEQQESFEFSSPDQKIASQPGFIWKPNDATPEQIKEWQEKDGKWWADRALLFVGIATFTQVFMISFMLLSFYLIQLAAG